MTNPLKSLGTPHLLNPVVEAGIKESRSCGPFAIRSRRCGLPGRCCRSTGLGADAVVIVGDECGFTHRERPEPATDGPCETGRARHAKAVAGPPGASRMGTPQ